MSEYKLVNVSVANLYASASYKSEVTGQVKLGEKVQVLEAGSEFSLIRTNGDCEDWVDTSQLCEFKAFSQESVIVRSHNIRLLDDAHLSATPVRDATIGARLPLLQEKEDWLQLILPDGKNAWAEKRHFGEFPLFSREAVVNLAKEFLGLPYHWGGRSPKGLDCSGLVQLVFSLLGVQTPRDSHMQQKVGTRVSKDRFEARPGDLLFFARDGKHVTHVAISLGQGRLIHASGMVGINSLKPDDPDFSPKLSNTFFDLRTL